MMPVVILFVRVFKMYMTTGLWLATISAIRTVTTSSPPTGLSEYPCLFPDTNGQFREANSAQRSRMAGRVIFLRNPVTYRKEAGEPISRIVRAALQTNKLFGINRR